MEKICHVCSSEKIKIFMVKDGVNYNKRENCSHEFIFPQPSDKELNAIYTKEYYNAWGLNKSEKETATVKYKQNPTS